jgi:hypothetical protein
MNSPLAHGGHLTEGVSPFATVVLLLVAALLIVLLPTRGSGR